MKGGYALKEEDWNSGENLWFTEMIAPFGNMDEIVSDLKKLRRKLFPDKVQEGKALRVDNFGKVRKVIKVFG